MRRDRDSIVANGRAAHERSMTCERQKGPWLYRSKIKSGNRVTQNIEGTFTSVPHLMGELIEKYAKEEETLNVYGISRVMKAHLRSYREDV